MTAVRPAPPGVVGGYAPLDSGLLIPRAYLPAVSAAGQGACPQLSGSVVDVLHGDGAWGLPNAAQKGMFYATDMWNATEEGPAPWSRYSIGSGTRAQTVGDTNHPGVVSYRSSTSPNSGYSYYLGNASFVLAGNESTEFVFKMLVTADTTMQAGFGDSYFSTAQTDGVWMEIVGTTLTGYAKNNAGPTATASTYTISQGTWYRGRIATSADATRADFTLYTCSNGALVWTDYVTSNIPTASGRNTGHIVLAINSGTSQQYLVDVDYINVAINRTLVR